jgi:hypothetical protein
MCPNPNDARSWYKCKDAAECTSPLTAVQARVQRKPLELKCIDNSAAVSGLCDPSLNASYYLSNLTEWDSDGLFVGCFLRGAQAAHPAALLCAPPLLIDDLASVFTPRTIEHVNQPDVCGYNFVPYATLEALRSRFGGVVAGDFTIEWSRSSYASQESTVAQRPSGRPMDYSLIERSTLPMPRTGLQAGALWV